MINLKFLQTINHRPISLTSLLFSEAMIRKGFDVAKFIVGLILEWNLYVKKWEYLGGILRGYSINLFDNRNTSNTRF
jgi:hypothetical protein